MCRLTEYIISETRRTAPRAETDLRTQNFHIVQNERVFNFLNRTLIVSPLSSILIAMIAPPTTVPLREQYPIHPEWRSNK